MSVYTHKFTDVQEFAAHYQATYCDFVYDEASATFYTNFVDHAEFIANLYLQNGGKDTGSLYQNQDAFVLSGMGLFKSRAGNSAMCSQDFVLPKELWFLRRDLCRMGA